MTDEATSTYSIISFPALALPSTYHSMIFSKWLRSQKYGLDYFKLIDSDTYFAAYHKHVSFIMTQPNTVVRLAVLSEDHDVVLGFIVCRDNVLDYVHVQKDYRKQGIATTLLPEEINTFSSLTNVGMTIWTAKHPSFKFNPFA
jgi:GNAT superfamily N-acetyltransferase